MQRDKYILFYSSTRVKQFHLSTMLVYLHMQFDPEQSSRQFGVELSQLTSDDRAVPLVVEKLINYIEMHGLYTEGIYSTRSLGRLIKTKS